MYIHKFSVYVIQNFITAHWAVIWSPPNWVKLWFILCSLLFSDQQEDSHSENNHGSYSTQGETWVQQRAVIIRPVISLKHSGRFPFASVCLPLLGWIWYAIYSGIVLKDVNFRSNMDTWTHRPTSGEYCMICFSWLKSLRTTGWYWQLTIRGDAFFGMLTWFYWHVCSKFWYLSWNTWCVKFFQTDGKPSERPPRWLTYHMDRLRLHPTWGSDACPTTAIVGVDPAFRTGCNLPNKSLKTSEKKQVDI